MRLTDTSLAISPQVCCPYLYSACEIQNAHRKIGYQDAQNGLSEVGSEPGALSNPLRVYLPRHRGASCVSPAGSLTRARQLAARAASPGRGF